MRATLLVIVAFAAVVVAGCGSSDETVGSGNQTFTVPSDTHGVYAELKAILDQLPYQGWYTRCVVKRVEDVLGPSEAEALSELPESEREKKATEITAKAGPACEKRTHRPVIDPNATSKELDLLRAGYVTSMKSLAETNGLTTAQTECVERGFKGLPTAKIIAIGNSTEKSREGILLSVFKPCAKVK